MLLRNLIFLGLPCALQIDCVVGGLKARLCIIADRWQRTLRGLELSMFIVRIWRRMRYLCLRIGGCGLCCGHCPPAVQYMDKTFVKNFGMRPVYQRGLEIWTEQIIQPPATGKLLERLFLIQIEKERAGSAIDQQVMRGVTNMMIELGKPVYTQYLERPVLDSSRAYFQCVLVCSVEVVVCTDS